MKSKKESRSVVKVFGNEKNYFHFQLSLSFKYNLKKLIRIFGSLNFFMNELWLKLRNPNKNKFKILIEIDK